MKLVISLLFAPFLVFVLLEVEFIYIYIYIYVSFLSKTMLCKKFSQPIRLNAANSFLLSFSRIMLQCALNSYSSHKCNLQCIQNYSLNYLFYAVFQKFDQKFGEKLVIKFILMEQINFTNISFFCILHLLLLRKSSQSCVARGKLCLRCSIYISFC